jgi:anaerobic selenocysteine-containing dehydrogenase
MGMTRREFLKIAAVGGGAATFAACVPVAGNKFQIQSPVYMTEDLVAGSDQWFATLCGACQAGCGVVVRVMEGRAKKVEGNPNHPVNSGKLCPRGQALIQTVYHPDRVLTPLRRKGDRGSGQWEAISWDEALNQILAELKKVSKPGELLLVTEPLKGVRRDIVSRFAQALQGQHLAFEPLPRAAQKAIMEKLFGTRLWPQFDIANASMIVSFGADFLGGWISPVQHGFAYGSFRGREGARGRLVVLDPNFSLTAANADKWIPLRPGTEGMVALGLARLMLESGKVERSVADALTGGKGAPALEAYSPDRVEAASGVPSKVLEGLAADMLSLRPALVLAGDAPAGHTNATEALLAIYLLNFLTGSVGQKGGILPPAEPPLPGYQAMSAAPLTEWEALAQGQRLPRVLVVHGADPVHYLPGQLKLTEGLARVPLIVSMSTLMDDTAHYADLVLPDATSLEDWGDDVPDPGPAAQTYTFQQPLLKPRGEARSFYDLLLTLASELGGAAKQALPFKNYKEAILQSVVRLQSAGMGSITEKDPAVFQFKLQQAGVWTGGPNPAAWRPLPQVLPAVKEPEFAGEAGQYPLHLVPFVTATLGDNGGGLPWLEALPDPTTTVAWQTWVQIAPQTAAQLGVREGDIVTVETPVGRMEAPVYVHPAVPPYIVAVPVGRGYINRSRYARKENSEQNGIVQILGIRVIQGAAPTPTANPLAVVANLKDAGTGAPALMATRARLATTGRRVKVLKMEGTVEPVANPEIVKVSAPKGK